MDLMQQIEQEEARREQARREGEDTPARTQS